MTLKSFNVWFIYQINTLEHLMLSFFLILESLKRFELIFIYLPYGVGNFGQFDDRTLFGNKSNLHAEIAFNHNISR